LRCPYTTLHPSLYAEDGAIFLQSALDHGIGSIFELYAGYSHLLQRIVAILAVKSLSPLYYPNFFLFFAWASYLLPLVTSEVLIGSGAYRPIVRCGYIPYIFYPNATETYLNLPNSYIFFPLAFILLAYSEVSTKLGASSKSLAREKSILVRVILLFYGIISALTGPFLAIYTIPLIILQSIKAKKIPLRPLWLSIPIALSWLQIYFSQFNTDYPVTTKDAIAKILQNPELIVQWAAFNLASPLMGGQNAVKLLSHVNIEAKILFILLIFGLVIIATKIVLGSTRQPIIIKIAILSTTLLSLSSLLVSLKRGYDIKIIAGYDAGGRFFIWNTILFTSILLIALVIQTQKMRVRRDWKFNILATWLILGVITFKNQIGPRITSPTYLQQIYLQCESERPAKILIWPEPKWSFKLTDPILHQACTN
jgi:hypothetical protein